MNDGFYLVPTTWRALVDSAITTGRDQRDWLSAYPQLARLEILARITPLRAYVGRRSVNGSAHAVANDVYLNGTERTAQAATGYRVGMTMAEFVARTLLGLGPTSHAESTRPNGAGLAWGNGKKQPDLVASRGGLPWLIEAKGGKKVGLPALRSGVTQLIAPDLMAGPHVRVLCGASLSHRLSMTVDIELPPAWEQRRDYYRRSGNVNAFMSWIESRAVRDAAADLARSRMLVYHAITSASAEQKFVRRFQDQPSPSRGQQTWATEPTEHQSSVWEQQLSDQGGTAALADIIGVRVPGTGLSVGLSAQLYAACRANVQFDRAAAQRADELSPRALLGDADDAYVPAAVSLSADPATVDYRITKRATSYERAYSELRGQADDEIISAYERFEAATAEDTLPNEQLAVRARPDNAYEALSQGTYIAIDADTIPTLGS